MEKIYYIDRIEGNVIVCQNEEDGMLELDRSILPEAKEGDCVVFNGEGYSVDTERTQKRKEKMNALLDDLFG